MEGLALYKFHEVLRVSHELYGSTALGAALLMAGVLGVPVRLSQFTAIAFDYPDLGRKFRTLFPAVLLLDVVWSAKLPAKVGVVERDRKSTRMNSSHT